MSEDDVRTRVLDIMLGRKAVYYGCCLPLGLLTVYFVLDALINTIRPAWMGPARVAFLVLACVLARQWAIRRARARFNSGFPLGSAERDMALEFLLSLAQNKQKDAMVLLDLTATQDELEHPAEQVAYKQFEEPVEPEPALEPEPVPPPPPAAARVETPIPPPAKERKGKRGGRRKKGYRRIPLDPEERGTDKDHGKRKRRK